jgi:PRC-barrel domain protein
MTKAIVTVVVALLLDSARAAQAPEGARLLPTLPADVTTVANYYRQNVYDPGDQKIGGVVDLLIDKEALVSVAMVSVGSFLALDKKIVAVPFSALRLTYRKRKPYLVLDTTRGALKAARAFAWNRVTERWERVVDAEDEVKAKIKE